ncbi:MAG: hypothetical protein ABI567_02795 [Gammaproteobacteria bacterium]
MLFAIVMGTFGGAILAFYTSKWLLERITHRFARHVEQLKTVRVTAMIFGAIALAPAIFLSVMGGGIMGTRYAGMVADAIGIGDIGGAVILAVEVVAAIAIIVTINTAMGAVLGVLFARGLYRGGSRTEDS